MDPGMFMVLDFDTELNDCSTLWLLVPIFLRMPRCFHVRLVAYLDPISLARLERVCHYWRYFLGEEGEEYYDEARLSIHDLPRRLPSFMSPRDYFRLLWIDHICYHCRSRGIVVRYASLNATLCDACRDQILISEDEALGRFVGVCAESFDEVTPSELSSLFRYVQFEKLSIASRTIGYLASSVHQVCQAIQESGTRNMVNFHARNALAQFQKNRVQAVDASFGMSQVVRQAIQDDWKKAILFARIQKAYQVHRNLALPEHLTVYIPSAIKYRPPRTKAWILKAYEENEMTNLGKELLTKLIDREREALARRAREVAIWPMPRHSYNS